jgi:hypothetical protein
MDLPLLFADELRVNGTQSIESSMRHHQLPSIRSHLISRKKSGSVSGSLRSSQSRNEVVVKKFRTILNVAIATKMQSFKVPHCATRSNIQVPYY